MHYQRISSGSVYEEQMCYSRAVVAAPFIFVSGTTGFNYATMTIADDIVLQAVQTCLNIERHYSKQGPLCKTLYR